MISSKALHNFVNILIIKHDFHKILRFFLFDFLDVYWQRWIEFLFDLRAFVSLLDADADDNGDDLIPSAVTTTVVADQDYDSDDEHD